MVSLSAPLAALSPKHTTNLPPRAIISPTALLITAAHLTRTLPIPQTTPVTPTRPHNHPFFPSSDLPECDTAFATYFIYDRPINVTCTVSAFPPASAILWRWNSSSEVMRAAPETLQHEKTTAMLTVHPQQRQEDRALSCWAVNEMGRQLKPCSFSVKVASK